MCKYHNHKAFFCCVIIQKRMEKNPFGLLSREPWC